MARAVQRMSTTSSVEFFDRQFDRQIAQHDFALNPFESAAIPFLQGRVLDFGCGLGNLAVHAARRGHEVVALDASPSAIEHLRQVAARQGLPLRAIEADLRSHRLDEQFDTVVSIGLLMFFDCPTAFRQLEHLKSLVAPGGVAVVNVLTEGTTFTDMFAPEGHCLFGKEELANRFAGWELLAQHHSSYPAPNDSVKAFATLIARRPP